MNTTQREKSIKEIVLGKCWAYLNDNLHKFSEANKIKVALALAQKNMPQEIIGGVAVTNMPTIRVASGEDNKERPLEFNIGTPDPPEDTRHPGEAKTDNQEV